MSKLDYILNYLKNSDIINNLYKELTKMEINNELHTKNYESYVGLIKCLVDENKEIENIASYYDDELNEVLDTIIHLNEFSDNPIDFINETKNIKVKRLLSHFNQISLIKNDMPKEQLIDKFNSITVNGKNIPVSEAIELIECYDEDQADYIKNIIDLNVEKMYDFQGEYACLLSCREGLQYHLIANYLQKSIESEKNIKVKNKLIEFKYKLIGIYKYLEDPFLKNPYNYSRINYYQEILQDYKDNEEFFTQCDLQYKDYIGEILYSLINIDEEKLNNINTNYYKKLLLVFLNTYKSMLYNEEILDVINEDIKFAIKKINNKNCKKIVLNSINVPNLLLSKKLINN